MEREALHAATMDAVPSSLFGSPDEMSDIFFAGGSNTAANAMSRGTPASMCRTVLPAPVLTCGPQEMALCDYLLGSQVRNHW